MFDKVKVLISLDETKKNAPKVVYDCVDPEISPKPPASSTLEVDMSDAASRKRLAEAELLKKQIKKARKE